MLKNLLVLIILKIFQQYVCVHDPWTLDKVCYKIHLSITVGRKNKRIVTETKANL